MATSRLNEVKTPQHDGTPRTHGAVGALSHIKLRHLLEEGPRGFGAHFGEELDVVVAVEARHFQRGG